MGARRLSQWLRYPLQDQAQIDARLDAVEFFKDNGLLRQRWRQTLKGLGDLERLTARVALEQATPREVAAVKEALARVPLLQALLPAELPALVAQVASDLDGLPALQDLDRPGPGGGPPGQSCRRRHYPRGVRPELDELIALNREGKDWIARLEAKERARLASTR